MVQKINKLVLKGFLGVLMFACLSLVIDNKAEAIVDIRAGYGFGNLNLEGSKLARQSGANVELMFQPIIVLPIATGVSYVYHNLNGVKKNKNYESYERIGVDVEAWIPFIPLITPFAGATFIPWHEFSVKDAKEEDLKMGFALKAGVKVDIIPFLNAFLEGQYSKFKSDAKEDYSSLVGVLGLELDI